MVYDRARRALRDLRWPSDSAGALPRGSPRVQPPPSLSSICVQLASGARHQDQQQLALSGTHPRPTVPCKKN
eukprot:15230386-Alexandrium_andersonii.AAC.1